tara:strand:+ start:290 stop:622 length:333 start_codon:yes stop_codon:yes gene_type:complete
VAVVKDTITASGFLGSQKTKTIEVCLFVKFAVKTIKVENKMKNWKVYIDYRQRTAFDDGRLDIRWVDEKRWKGIVNDALNSCEACCGYIKQIYVKNPEGKVIEKHTLIKD